jgi:flagellin-specific chaperone FliS
MQNQAVTVRNYMEQEIAGKTPGELLLLLYDTGQRACKRRDRRLAIGVLVELIGGVDVSHGEIAEGLIALYDYALREVRENRFEFAGTMMVELGQAYREAMDQLQSAGLPIPQPVD